jgi:serine/threonine protein kinase
MDDDKQKLYQKIIEDEPSYKFNDHSIKISEDAGDLISKLLNKNPLQRIKSKDIPSHKWFKDVNFDDIRMGEFNLPSFQ